MISELVYSRFGVNLTEKKKALVRGRLSTLIRSLGFSNFEDYYNAVINDRTGNSLLSLIDRISTNHSFFFREDGHFDFLINSVLPEICEKPEERKSNDLRIWCAGCAAGEEAYTVAMVLTEFFGFDLCKWDPGILATDISTTALKQAEAGIYAADSLKSVPAIYKRKYFRRLSPDSYAVADGIKSMVLFKRLNLMRDFFPFKGKFHVIFCRNVMIYFDQETRDNLIQKFHNYMYAGSYLFIGHSESLGRKTGIFRYIQPTVYKRC